MYIYFFKEQGWSNWIVMAKEENKPYVLLPYSIWFDKDNRQYIAVKVKNNPTVDTVIDSNDHEEDAEAFKTLKEAKDYLIKRAKIANGKEWKENIELQEYQDDLHFSTHQAID